MTKAVAEMDGKRLRRELQSLCALARGDDPYWNFQRIMDLEGELGVRSTFFFLDERGKATLTCPGSMMLYWGRYRLDSRPVSEVIRQLADGGWEIGLHGSYGSYVDEAMLRQEKERLEAITGAAVAGVRQHYLRLSVPETWRIHAALGFRYDSTLGYTDRVGFRRGATAPFFPTDPSTGERIEVLQIPLGIMDIALAACASPWPEALRCIEQIEAVRGVLTINWHQRVFNPWDTDDLPDLYRRILSECRRRGAWIAPLGRVAEWWLSENSDATESDR